MAVGLANRYAVVNDPGTAPTQQQQFIQKVQEAIAETALAVYSEPANTAGHAVRAAFASRVLNSLSSAVPAFAQALAAQGLDNTSTDAQISNGVSAAWNAICGA